MIYYSTEMTFHVDVQRRLRGYQKKSKKSLLKNGLA